HVSDDPDSAAGCDGAAEVQGTTAPDGDRVAAGCRADLEGTGPKFRPRPAFDDDAPRDVVGSRGKPHHRATTVVNAARDVVRRGAGTSCSEIEHEAAADGDGAQIDRCP